MSKKRVGGVARASLAPSRQAAPAIVARMRVLPWLTAVIHSEVPLEELAPFRNVGIDAYVLVERLPRGSARVAAWDAYVCRTYADALVGSAARGYLNAESARLASELYLLAGKELERASAEQELLRVAAAAPGLPRWRTPVRAQSQLVAMRQTLDVLRTFLAHELDQLGQLEPEARDVAGSLLETVEERFQVEGMWIARPPAELRGRIGDLLMSGLEQAYALGQLLSQPELLTRRGRGAS